MYDHSPQPDLRCPPRRLNHWHDAPPETFFAFAVHEDGRVAYKSDRSMSITKAGHPDAALYVTGGRAPGLAEAGWAAVVGLADG